MREIEFRGKRKDNGDWVYGGILQKDDYTAIVVWSDYKGWHEFIEIDPETVGQCTGLEDKNKQKTYKDDEILLCESRIKGIVKYDNWSCQYVVVDKENRYITDFKTIAEQQLTFEVIGNIYEGSEG